MEEWIIDIPSHYMCVMMHASQKISGNIIRIPVPHVSISTNVGIDMKMNIDYGKTPNNFCIPIVGQHDILKNY